VFADGLGKLHIKSAIPEPTNDGACDGAFEGGGRGDGQERPLDNYLCTFLKSFMNLSVPNFSYQACPLCCSEWPSLSLSNSIVNPHSIVFPGQQMASTFTNDGESPNFVASIPAFPGSQTYCTMVSYLTISRLD